MKIINTYVGRMALVSFMFVGLFAISSVGTFAYGNDGTSKPGAMKSAHSTTSKPGKKKHRMRKTHHPKAMKSHSKMPAK